MVTFAINHALTGLDPYYFKITNVAIHILNGIALYFFLAFFFAANRSKIPDAITNSELATISVLITICWLLHPINLTGVLYVVQRMTSLAAFFGLWSLVFYLWGRTNQVNGKSGGLQLFIGMFLLMPLAVFSKENAALLPLFWLLLEWLCFRCRLANDRLAWPLILFNIFCVIIPLTVFVGFYLTEPHYRFQDFTAWERLLTESRVMWFYLRLIALPQLADLSLYHDDVLLSTTPFDPPTTLLAIVGILGLLCTGLALRKHAPVYAFGILFFLLAHTSESTIVSLELVYEHRNYLPSIGILLIVFYYLLYPLHMQRTLIIRRTLAIIFILVSAGTTMSRATFWGSEGGFAIYSAANRLKSSRAHYFAGEYYLHVMQTEPEKREYAYGFAVKHLLQIHQVAPKDATGLMRLLLVKHRDRTQWFKHLKQRLASQELIYVTFAALLELGECAKKSSCLVTKTEIFELLTTAVQNPMQKPVYKARLLHNAGMFAYIQGNSDQAIEFAKQSIASDPSWPDTWHSLISTLIQVGQIQQAEQQILALQQLPTFTSLTAEIPVLKAAIKNYRKNRHTSVKQKL